MRKEAASREDEIQNVHIEALNKSMDEIKLSVKEGFERTGRGFEKASQERKEITKEVGELKETVSAMKVSYVKTTEMHDYVHKKVALTVSILGLLFTLIFFIIKHI
jgi:predicted translin family RNA/ssDNA-binding protein